MSETKQIDSKKELFNKLKTQIYAEEYKKYGFDKNGKKIHGREEHLDCIIHKIISVCENGGINPLKKTMLILPDRTGNPAEFATMEHNKEVAQSQKDFICFGDREYGPPITEIVGDVKITYPEWARRAVYRWHPHRKDEKVIHVETVRWKDSYQKVGKYKIDSNKKPIDPNTPKDQWINYPYPMCATASQRRGIELAFWELLGDLRKDDEREFYEEDKKEDKKEKYLKQETVLTEKERQEASLDALIKYLSDITCEAAAMKAKHYLEKNKEKIEKARQAFPEKSKILKNLLDSKIYPTLEQKKNSG